ncbi:MAG: 6-phosphogluconolactonase, partial [Patescibacteria group bacterium]
MNPSIIIAENEADFRARGASLLSAGIRKAILDRGRAIVGFSGGSTPKAIYEMLGQDPAIDWSKVWIFLVDDRFIRKDDPRSNQFLLRSTLLKHAPVPESQIIIPDTTLPYQESIALYEKHLEALLEKGPPDIVTLGLGGDGHIASLFP